MTDDFKVSYDFAISHACDVADDIMDMLVELSLCYREDLENGNDEDPSGFTPIGRELFEFIYNRVRGLFE